MVEQRTHGPGHGGVDNLVIHPTHNDYRAATEKKLEQLGIESFDRIAIERASEKIASDDKVMMGWIKLLKDLHGFTQVHIFEAPHEDPTIKAVRAFARPALESTFPELKVHVHSLHKELLAPVGNLVITCVDNRFQDAYQGLSDSYETDKYHLISVPGASSALSKRIVRANVATHQKDGLERIVVMDHTDCGEFGGLDNFNGSETAELQQHFESQNVAEAELKQLAPEAEIESLVVSVDNLSQLQQAA